MENHHPMLLFKAAKEGNTMDLQRLLEEDPLVLDRGFGSESPLHIASMLGHVGFVRELMKHKTNNVGEMGPHGLSPLHLASANGHTEVVKELLEVNKELCGLRGRDGLSPLHCASSMGRVGAIVELLKASPSSVFEVTLFGQTSVHLAAKMNQLEGLKTLVEEIKVNNMLTVLSLRDEEGNTALHLAAARRNYLAIEVLLKCNASETNGTHEALIQVNARNNHGLTPLDLAQISPSPCSCPFVDQHHSRDKTLTLLLQAGAATPPTSNWVPKKTQTHQSPQPNTLSDISSNTLRAQNQQSQDNQDMMVLVVLTLIALVAYQAMQSPPVWIAENGPLFVWFAVCNSSAFFISVAVIWVVVRDCDWCLAVYVALLCLVSCYDCAVYRASPPGKLRKVAICICLVLPFFPLLALQVKNLRLCRLRQRSGLV